MEDPQVKVKVDPVQMTKNSELRKWEQKRQTIGGICLSMLFLLESSKYRAPFKLMVWSQYKAKQIIFYYFISIKSEVEPMHKNHLGRKKGPGAQW